MASKDSTEKLLAAFKEFLDSGSEISEVPFVVFKGDPDGKGMIWSGQGNNKQLIFAANPDRFFVSESIDLAKNKSINVNNVKILDDKELGPTVIKSNLKEVGRLRGLIVDGSISVNQYLFYDANTDRLGLGTDQPHGALSVVDQNVEIILGSSDTGSAAIGTYNSAGVEIVTDNTARISIGADGNIDLGNNNFGPIKVRVLGQLGINVNTPDPRADLHVNGAVKLNNTLHIKAAEPPNSGSYNLGDIVWNSEPTRARFVGWVCTQAGNPGVWSGFGRIE